jgi:hypothetical protein
LDWVERFFFGFILGFFSVSVIDIAVFPLLFLLVAFHLENYIGSVFYVVPVFFLIFLITLRTSFQTPLCSDKMKTFFYSLFSRHRSYWPFLLIISSLTAFLALKWSNPFLSSNSVLLWGSFVITLNFSVIVSIAAISWLVVQTSALSSSKIEPFEVPALVFKCYFVSFFKREARRVVTDRGREKKDEYIS